MRNTSNRWFNEPSRLVFSPTAARAVTSAVTTLTVSLTVYGCAPHSGEEAESADSGALIRGVSQYLDSDDDGVDDDADPCPGLADRFGPNCAVDTSGYTLVYDLTPPPNARWLDAAQVAAAYSYNAAPGYAAVDFTKIGYLVTIDDNYVWATVDDFTADNEAQIGVPSDWIYDQPVSNVNVVSSVAGVSATNAAGTVEMWSYCYLHGSDSNYNHDDEIYLRPYCYGSMQLHVGTQTIFAFNSWSGPGVDDLGIGNAAGLHSDWTYAVNLDKIRTARIQIFIRSADSDGDGVIDTRDAALSDARVCRDSDGDGCDDCAHTGADASGGSTAFDCPMRSCSSVLAFNEDAESGVYALDLDGDAATPPVSAYCDMTESDGGWTMILSSTLANDGSTPNGYFDGTGAGEANDGADDYKIAATASDFTAMSADELRVDTLATSQTAVFSGLTGMAAFSVDYTTCNEDGKPLGNDVYWHAGRQDPVSCGGSTHSGISVGSGNVLIDDEATFHYGHFHSTSDETGQYWFNDSLVSEVEWSQRYVYWLRGEPDVDSDGSVDSADCAPRDASIYPGAVELIADGIDQDCDGGDSCFHDDDGDGFLDASGDTVTSLDLDCADLHEGTPSSLTTDCNDADATSSPAGSEVCDAADVDEDCNGSSDDNDSSVSEASKSTFYRDADGDSYGAASDSQTRCDAGVGYVADHTDCNDGDASVNTAASEICDAANVDEDCDGAADDADLSVAMLGKVTYYPDADGDGYGLADAPQASCDAVDGYVATTGDCNDADGTINPGATELAGDSIDQNCDGVETCYADTDNDGHRSNTTILGGEPKSATAAENQALTISCETGVIEWVGFASYGTPGGGTSSSSAQGACHAANSLSVVSAACVGQASCTITANNLTFGDPCVGTVKRLHVTVGCTDVDCTDAYEGEAGDEVGESKEAQLRKHLARVVERLRRKVRRGAVGGRRP